MEKKTLLIPPPLVRYRFVTDIKAKKNIFNSFFADQMYILKK